MKNLNKIEIVGSVKSIHICDVGKQKKVTACVAVQRKDEPPVYISVETWDPGCAGMRAGETLMVIGRTIARKYVRNDGSVGVMFVVFANKMATVASNTPHRANVSLSGVVGRVWNGTDETLLSLETNHVYKDSEGNAVIDTTWHMVYVKKGTDAYPLVKDICRGHTVHIEGKLEVLTYVNYNGTECNSFRTKAVCIEKQED